MVRCVGREAVSTCSTAICYPRADVKLNVVLMAREHVLTSFLPYFEDYPLAFEVTSK